MNNVVHPEPFNDFGFLWLYYVLCWGLIWNVLVYAVGSVGLLIFTSVTRQISKWRERVVLFTAFMTILLVVGGFANALWCCLVSGNLYWEQDVDSPEDDFTPFFPIDQSWLVMQHGHTLTVSTFQLQLVWLLFAASTWVVSYVIYRFFKTKIVPVIGDWFEVKIRRMTPHLF
jgi:hypothetical protein